MVKFVSSGKNTSTEIETGCDLTMENACPTATTAGSINRLIKQSPHRQVLFDTNNWETHGANVWTTANAGTGVLPNAAIDADANYIGGFQFDTGAGVGVSNMYHNIRIMNPTAHQGSNTAIVIEFDLETDGNFGNLATNSGIGLGRASLATGNDYIGIRKKTGVSTIEYVTDNGGTETANDSAAAVTANAANHFKFVLYNGQVDFYCNDMETPEASHTTNLPEQSMLFHIYAQTTGASAAEFFVSNIVGYLVAI